VQLKGLAQPVEHELFDDPGIVRDVLRKNRTAASGDSR
jgi:hypothetical protein